ncbi:MAG: hypothetical protein EAZ27_00190, partial [Cytophagales bacterium]
GGLDRGGAGTGDGKGGATHGGGTAGDGEGDGGEARAGGGGEGEKRHAGQLVTELGQHAILRAEIMPPFRNTVSFINRHK